MYVESILVSCPVTSTFRKSILYNMYIRDVDGIFSTNISNVIMKLSMK